MIELSESLFQILLLIAYLAIALISIVIATYAISVSYLGRETSRAIWRMKKRHQELKEKIKKLGEKAEIEEVKQEIKRYEKEERELGIRLIYLSKDGAVLFPSLFYFIALITVIYAIYVDLKTPLSELLTLIAGVCVGIGFLHLVKTLGAIESAALRVPLPELKVSYLSLLSSEKFHSKEHKEIELAITNNGEVLAENVDVFLFFPPEFKVGERERDYQVFKQPPESNHPDYSAVIYTIDSIHIDVALPLTPIPLDMPEKTGSYTIPVAICERKIGETTHQLTLEIVS